jgi:hypothetical protein
MNEERRRIFYPVLAVPIVSSLIALVLDNARDFDVFIMSFTSIPMLALTIISTIKGFNGYEYNGPIFHALFMTGYFVSCFMLYRKFGNTKMVSRGIYSYNIIQGLILLFVVIGKGC